MQEMNHLFQSLHDVVLHPSIYTAIPLMMASAINEIPALFPLAIVIASQLAFLKEPLTWTLVGKLITLVSIPIGLGSAIGTIPLYVIAYAGGRPAINRYSKYLRFSWEDVERAKSHFSGHWYDEVLYVALHSIPVLPSLPITMVGGVVRMPFWKYFVLTALGFIIRMILTLAIFGFGFFNLSKLIISIYNI